MKVLVEYIACEDRRAFVEYVLKQMRKFKVSEDLPGMAALGEDCRTLEVRHQSHTGVRFRPFEDALHYMSEEDFPDWPVEGPRTTKWLAT